MLKKRQMTNKLYGANGGWAAIRTVKYDGLAKVYDEPYHQVTPIVSNGDWNQMVEYAVNTFGPSGTADKPGVWTPHQRWYVNNAKFLFKDKSDCEWFLLRWQ